MIPIFPYNIQVEAGRLGKCQGIINSHASTLSAQEQRLPIKPSLWQSWLLQNTISYCFSILGQCTRATGAMCIDHTLRDKRDISSDCVYSQQHFCYVFLLLWWTIFNNNAGARNSCICHVYISQHCVSVDSFIIRPSSGNHYKIWAYFMTCQSGEKKQYLKEQKVHCTSEKQ